MKYALFILIVCFPTLSKAQSLMPYTDSVHQFSIGIPAGWRYGKPAVNSTIQLMAYRMATSQTDTVLANFNMNILETPGINLPGTYDKFFRALNSTSNLNLLGQGDTVINGNAFKWLMETHANEQSGAMMQNYVFVTYYDEHTYILTLVSKASVFAEQKNMLSRIAGSFKLL